MLTDNQRREWLAEALRSHPLCKPLMADPPPDLTVSNTTYREAQQAWLDGLYVSTVLCSYAACEITLAFRLSLSLRALPDEAIVEWEELNRRIAEADRQVQHLTVKHLLIELGARGLPLEQSLGDDLLKLCACRNSLAHYRPTTESRTILSSSGDSFIAHLLEANVVKPETQESYAMHGIVTMFDLWSAPLTSVTQVVGDEN
jgi:hypothetical protein